RGVPRALGRRVPARGRGLGRGHARAAAGVRRAPRAGSRAERAAVTLEEYLAVPYRLHVYSAPDPDGDWHRYAAYPELGCVSTGETPMEAMENLEQQRIRYILERVQLGQPGLPRVHDEAAAVDQARCLTYLRDVLGLQRVGVIGWCMGGRMVLRLAAGDPGLAACVAYFPTLREPRPEHEADVIAVVDRIVCPVQALYGGKDHVTAPAAFASLQAALQRRSQPTMIHVYPDADHGFLAE